MSFSRAILNCRRCQELCKHNAHSTSYGDLSNSYYRARNEALKALENVRRDFLLAKIAYAGTNHPEELDYYTKRNEVARKALGACHVCKHNYLEATIQSIIKSSMKKKPGNDSGEKKEEEKTALEELAEVAQGRDSGIITPSHADVFGDDDSLLDLTREGEDEEGLGAII